MRPLAALLALVCIALAPLTAEKRKDEVMVNFAGALKRVNKKEIVIEPAPDNEMTFVRTKRTTFLSGGKTVDGASLPAGIAVTVQAFEKMNREIEAVTVTVAIPDQAPIK